MALVYPLDILTGFPGWTIDFDLLWRQESSRTTGGRSIVKDLASPLWRAAYTTRTLAPNLLDEWRARLDALENGLQIFRGYALSRCFPIAHPNGLWPTGGAFSGAGTIGTIGVNRKAVSLSGFPEGFRLSVGDMIRIGGSDLHRVMEARTATALGNTSVFEIRPHLWPGVAAGAEVSVVRPYCSMTIEPGSISSSADLATGRGAVSFRAIEAR
jgi:hypothetical protein